MHTPVYFKILVLGFFCMRLALLTIFSLLPLSAMANEAMLVMPTAPWMDEQKPSTPDIQPKKISLADLEKMAIEEKQEKKEEKEPIKKSTLEDVYSNRIIDELEQYGYDFFDENIEPSMDVPAGTVQDDYVLSTGDRLNIILRGQLNTRRDYQINSQGLLVIDDLPPVTAAGRTLEEVRIDLQNEVTNLHNTQIYVSLSGVRQIGILVVGHVKKPGRKNLTSFHTALDALNAAGGINKSGSLRRIKLVRKGKSHFIDLYQLLMASGSNADKLLKDGDRIIVPPIGPTMAVSGSVKRPGIYEIKKGQKLSLHQALGLAGGVLTPGQNRYMKLEYTPDGEETVQDVSAPNNRIFGDGSILTIAQSEQKQASAITLSGHTRQPGTHDLKKSQTLSALITDEKVLGNDIYPLIGVIERRDEKQLTKKLIAFSPHQILQKEYDEKLLDGDKVRLFSAEQIRNLEKNPLFHEASMTSQRQDNIIEDEVLSAFLKERAAFIRGAVRQEGAYPVTQGTTLESLLAAYRWKPITKISN